MSSSLQSLAMSCGDLLYIMAFLDGHPCLVVGKKSKGCMKPFQHHPELNSAVFHCLLTSCAGAIKCSSWQMLSKLLQCKDFLLYFLWKVLNFVFHFWVLNSPEIDFCLLCEIRICFAPILHLGNQYSQNCYWLEHRPRPQLQCFVINEISTWI